tara:strand:+ start:371 stop:1495 length:1125 start_codon:yes stop_codon:yes gene_type:complete
MKWIGQHIYDLISRFRNDVYLEDISTGTIASGGNLGLDSNNKIVKANEASGDITGVTIETDSGSGAAFSQTSGSADFAIVGTSGVGVTNSSETITVTSVPGEIDHDSLLNFAANEHFTQANITTVGTIGTGVWQGTAIAHAYIGTDAIEIDNIADDQITVAKIRGSSIQTSGESFADNDTTLMTSAAIQDKIYGTTVVGTIATGTWQGTAVATDQQKHLANFEFEGFSVGDGTNYMIPEINSDTKAPFEHQTSTGSDGLTATSVITLLRTTGHVMPYAGTLKLWKGWATSSGSSQTVDIGLYKFTLVNNDNTAVSPVVLKNTSFTSVGNTKALTFAETSFDVAFAAGDILISAVRNGTNNKRCDFASTLVVEWD